MKQRGCKREAKASAWWRPPKTGIDSETYFCMKEVFGREKGKVLAYGHIFAPAWGDGLE